MLLFSFSSQPRKQLRKRDLQTLGNLFDIDERNIPNPSLHAAVVGPVQPASLGGFFLIDLLLFPNTANCATESDADVQCHSLPSWDCAADTYTADESHFY
jgi:hypothetical protein